MSSTASASASAATASAATASAATAATASAATAATASAATAATASAATAITIHIKIMAGDIISVAIPADASNHDAYSLVYRAMPDDIRPVNDQYLHLMRMVEEKEEEEEEEEDDSNIYHNELPFIAQDGDEFCMLIQQATYSLFMDYVCEAESSVEEYAYDCYRLVVIRDDIETVYSQKVYHPQGADTPIFILEEDIVETSPTELPGGELITINEDAGCENSKHIVWHIIKLGKIPTDFRETITRDFLAEWEYQCQSRFPPEDYDSDEVEEDRIM